MLTKELRVYHWDSQSSSISSDRLEDDSLPHLGRAIAAYRAKIGERLGRVRDAARAALDGIRPDRVEAVVKLLDEVSTYEWPRGPRQAERRVKVFEAAGRRHPVLDAETTTAILGTVYDPPPPRHDEVVSLLYADYPEFHRLTAFPADYSPEDLRADYDLAQAQALLYSATRVVVDARADFRHIVQYARLSRLLCRIQRLTRKEYRLVFDGPNSVLRHTHAYGVDFARFLAALVQARDWRMTAQLELRKGWRPLMFTLSAADGLRSRLASPSLFDSSLEETFARKFGEERDGWRLSREAAILEAGEALLVPDFVFTHADGTEVALEIVGYWTPEYLREKFDKLARVRAPKLIVAVRKALALQAGDLPAAVLPFSTGIRLRDLMPRLEAFRHLR